MHITEDFHLHSCAMLSILIGVVVMAELLKFTHSKGGNFCHGFVIMENFLLCSAGALGPHHDRHRSKWTAERMSAGENVLIIISRRSLIICFASVIKSLRWALLV